MTARFLVAAIGLCATGCFDFSRFDATAPDGGVVDLAGADLAGADLSGLSGFAGDFTLDSIHLLTPRTFFQVVQTPTSVFAIGGFGTDKKALASVERAPIVSGALGQFEPAGSLVTARGDFAAVLIDSTICVFGGATQAGSGVGALSSVECELLGPGDSPGGFAGVPASLVAARWGHSVILANGQLYVVGGRGGNDMPLLIAEASDVSSSRPGPFSNISALALLGGVSDACFFADGTTLFALGGYDSPNHELSQPTAAPLSPLGTFQNTSWMLGADRRDTVGCLLLAEHAFLIGGDRNGITQPDMVDAMIRSGDLVSGGTIAAQLDVPREGLGVAHVGVWAYAIGGQQTYGGAPLSTVARAQLK